MKSYNIAIIIAGIDEGYQSTIIKGIESYALSNGMNIAVFVSFSGVMDNQRHDAGEFNIFNLPDFRKFDGAILLTNTIDYEPVVSDILSKIKKAKIPAVSIDNDIAEFYHIGIDNARAMRDITEHVINEHNCRTLNYVSGPRDNPESVARFKSFLNVLEEHEIEIEQERIFYGDFRSPSGREAVEYFLGSGLELPDAIICANDTMAVSVMIALNGAGISVPEDVIVTGFDNAYSGRNYPTKLTSVERPLKRSGELACHMLMNHFKGVVQERSVLLDMHPNFTESCGCVCEQVKHNDIDAVKELNYKNYAKYESVSENLSLINRMSCQLVECESLEDYTEALKLFIPEINAEGFYICVCDDWDFEGNDSEAEYSDFTIKGYTGKIKVALAYSNGRFSTMPDFHSEDILPGLFSNTGKGRMYYFIPLHFRERCLGYMAILNSHFPLESSMFQTWCLTISNMLENIRKIICLDYAVQKLDKLYTVDTLCGIYNRNGFVRGTTNIFSHCIKRRRNVMLMFLDMDDLKYINDNYGHSTGDEAIKKMACAIRDSCTRGEVFCRFGGDEFIIFGADYNEEDAERLTEKIHSCIERINKKKKSPYTLSASIGHYITCPVEGDDIFQLVTAADNIMYESKKKKKLSKYLKTS